MLFNQSRYIDEPNTGWTMSTDGEIPGQNALSCLDWKAYLGELYLADLGQVLIAIKLLED